MAALLDAYRTGAGVDWTDYPRLSEAQELANRPLYQNLLAQEWLPAIPDVDARLRAGGARVADVAAGSGWSSIAMGRAYPGIEVHGLDLDADRDRPGPRATPRPPASRTGSCSTSSMPATTRSTGRFDLVTIFEAVHDLARPVEVLAAVRRLLTPGGTAIVMDEKVAEAFTAPGDDVERLMYGYSLFFCLANGLADRPSVGTGTVMRPSTFRAYAEAAGFRSGWPSCPSSMTCSASTGWTRSGRRVTIAEAQAGRHPCASRNRPQVPNPRGPHGRR